MSLCRREETKQSGVDQVTIPITVKCSLLQETKEKHRKRIKKTMLTEPINTFFHEFLVSISLLLCTNLNYYLKKGVTEMPKFAPPNSMREDTG